MDDSGDEEDVSISVPRQSERGVIGQCLENEDAAKPVRVLLVEDDSITRMIMAARLTSLRYKVETANDGQEALERLLSGSSATIDAILTDEQMPMMGGTNLAKKLADTALKGIPVFLMSSEINVETRQKAISVGVVDMFTKPVQNNTLLTIRQRLRSLCFSKQRLQTAHAGKKPSCLDAHHARRMLQIKRAVSLDESQRQIKRASLNPRQPLPALQPITEELPSNEDEEKSQGSAMPPKLSKALSMLPSLQASERCSSLPCALFSKEFLKSPDLSVPQLQIKPLDISIDLFPSLHKRVKPNGAESRSTPSTDTQDSSAVGVGPQVAASLAQLHHSKVSSAFQAINQLGTLVGSTKLKAEQLQTGAVLPQLQGRHASVTPKVSDLFQSHHQKYNDAHQVALKQQKQAEICTANRQAAILRFRAKRKQRTFEKKVRYASRKRLAEQRPRIKGQFVKAADLQAHQAAQS